MAEDSLIISWKGTGLDVYRRADKMFSIYIRHICIHVLQNVPILPPGVILMLKPLEDLPLSDVTSGRVHTSCMVGRST